MSKTASITMDLEDRDPNTLSQHLQVSWEDIIGEPDGIRGPECAWRVSNRCFQLSRNCCYICLSIIIAPLTAFCLGCTFACVAFEHIWCLNPCLRLWRISCSMTRSCCMACSQAVIVPIADGIGQVFSSIKVRSQTLPEGPDRKEDILLL